MKSQVKTLKSLDHPNNENQHSGSSLPKIGKVK